MKSYNLTIFDAKSEFNLETFYEEFAQVSDTEPLETKLGKNYVLIFGTDVELLDLSTFISSILFDNVGGYFLTEITSDVADSKQSIILDQVENGVAIRMAILYLLANQRNK